MSYYLYITSYNIIAHRNGHLNTSNKDKVQVKHHTYNCGIGNDPWRAEDEKKGIGIKNLIGCKSIQ